MNKERYLEFDIARTIALILMPIAHLLDSGRNLETFDTATIETNKWVLYIAAFGAFVFMMSLGINILLTKKNRSKELLVRGLKVFGIGLLLNILRYILPSILAYFITHDRYYVDYALVSSLASDILFFAGLCFIYFALMKKLKIKSEFIVLLSMLLAISNYIIPKPVISNALLSSLVGNFIHLDYLSAFSLSEWLIVPTIGYVFGEIYLKFKQKQQTSLFYKHLFMIGIVGLIVSVPILKLLDINVLEKIGVEYMSYDFDLWSAFILLLLYCILQPLVYGISIIIKNTSIKSFFINFSKGITIYYFIQWALIYWCQLSLGAIGYSFDRYVSNGLFWILAICIILISYLLMRLYLKFVINK